MATGSINSIAHRWAASEGYSIFELIVVVVIIGIIATVATQSMRSGSEVGRIEETRAELDRLAFAIAGDPAIVSSGVRTDFGYIGDVGALPPNLDALTSNPGGYSTWNGPYIRDAFSDGSADTHFKTDAWGQLYNYAGGHLITSSGGPTTLTRRIAKNTADLTANSVTAIVTDSDGDLPGSGFADSILVQLVYPDGIGGMAADVAPVSVNGRSEFGSIPIGLHQLNVIYTPLNDTITRRLPVHPGSGAYIEVQYPDDIWGGGSGTGSGCGSSGTIVLRPDGSGSLTNLDKTGCSNNWQCVSEASPDGDASTVDRPSNSFATDVYTLEDPAANSCDVLGVTVYCRVRKDKAQGNVKPTIYTNGTEYQGSTSALSSSFENYSHRWDTNPATASAWTWTEITDLQAGLSLSGQNINFPAFCTQVWVEVEYGD